LDGANNKINSILDTKTAAYYLSIMINKKLLRTFLFGSVNAF
jgi:hypothetical protein